jgi:hypothetical protein
MKHSTPSSRDAQKPKSERRLAAIFSAQGLQPLDLIMDVLHGRPRTLKNVLKVASKHFGLMAAQEAASAHHSKLEQRRDDLEREARDFGHTMGFLFEEEYAKSIGEWPRPAGYFEE